MAFIAKQLKAAQDVILGDAPKAPQGSAALGPVFSAPELVAWEAEDPDPVFVGPIRFRGLRPSLPKEGSTGGHGGGADTSTGQGH